MRFTTEFGMDQVGPHRYLHRDSFRFKLKCFNCCSFKTEEKSSQVIGPIRTDTLNRLLRFHVQPINLVFFQESHNEP